MILDEENYNFDELLKEQEYRKCAPDSKDPEVLLAGFLYFCEHHWSIRHPEQGRINFILFDAQIETVRSWLNTRYSLILKARQIGFSTLVAAFSYWSAQFYPDRPILMLSRTERDAIKLLQKAKYGRRFMDEWFLWRAGPINETQTKMEFSNGSEIESLPSTNPARGESAYLIVVDELAFLPNSEDAWSAIEPAADVGGRVIMLSTASGEGNLFHRLWVGASNGTNRFTPLFFPWSANGRTQDWYEAKSKDLSEWVMAQEYPSNPDDAFLKSGRPVFNLDNLRSIETEIPDRGWLKQETALSVPEFIEDGGALRVWEAPTLRGKYVIGADPSQGLQHGDYASIHVINARDYKVVAHWHGHIDPDLLATEILVPLGNWYNRALIGVESNNHGLTTLKFLALKKYHPIFMERSAKYKKSVPTDVLGFRTTQVTKPLMIDELNEALRGKMVLLDKETVAELRTFTRDDKGKMSGSPFDDRTISLAIANQMLKYVWLEQYDSSSKEPPPGSFGAWEKQLYGESFNELISGNKRKSRPKREPIGASSVRNNW
ncbi:terminase large subunit domain-containing protein [Ilumatobacter sp.]|uniref:terminase large subunit domain-containing protein n=1 Tax=Ilumatobacter sp. TaxID=1967498 RepID=UPI0037532AAD